MQLRTWLLIGLISYGALNAWQNREVTHGPGVVAPNAPTQHAASTNQVTQIHGYSITPLQDISIEARVLSKTNYSADREADISPVDLALGWGDMSDEAVLSQMRISQSRRFYFWNVENFPIPRQAIETQSANMHMIAADSFIEKQLKRVRKGQVVRISGALVEVKAQDGWSWRSSLTRSDTGQGACEVVLVKSLTIL